MSDFDGRMISVDGCVHFYPQWLFLQLKRINKTFCRLSPPLPILERDKESGFFRILPTAITALKPLWEMAHFNPYRKLRAFSPGFSAGRSKDSGYKGLLDLLLTGMPLNKAEMDRYEDDLQFTRLSSEHRRQQVDEALRQVRARRPAA
jgi:hypothetical protein